MVMNKNMKNIKMDDLIHELNKVFLLRNFENHDQRNYIDWTIDALRYKKDFIVYAPNASGKTVVANHLSKDNYYYHNNFIKFVDYEKIHNMQILEKQNKFCLSSDKTYEKIFENSGEENHFSMREFIAKSQAWSTPRCYILSSEIINSINKEVIKKALDNFDATKIKVITSNFNEFPLSDEKYFFMLQHINLNNAIASGIQSLNILNEAAEGFRELSNDAKLNGDGILCNEIIEEMRSNESLLNVFYWLIIYSFYAENTILQLIEINYDFLMIEDGFLESSDGNNEEYSFQKMYKTTKETTKAITRELIKMKIIDNNTVVRHNGNNTFSFMKDRRNITMDIFKRNSEGQNNLISLIFFINMINDERRTIILDDPFDSLDRQNTYEVCKFLKENKMKKIVFTHDINYVNMINEYIPIEHQKNEDKNKAKGSKWTVLFMKNKLTAKSSQLLNIPRRIKYEYNKYFEIENYGKGVLLICRHIMENTWTTQNTFKEINQTLYKEPSSETIHSTFNVLLSGYDELKSDHKLYSNLIRLYDELALIKSYAYNKYGKGWRDQILNNTFAKTDIFLLKYSEIYFFINDMSHNNDWGYCIWDILSYENEIDEIIKVIKKRQAKPQLRKTSRPMNAAQRLIK